MEGLRWNLEEEIKRLREIKRKTEELIEKADKRRRESTVSLLDEAYDDLDLAINNIERCLSYIEDLEEKAGLPRLVGKRVIMESSRGDLHEVKILEVSPDQEFIKVEYEDGETEWKGVDEITVKSILESDEQSLYNEDS